MTDDKGLGALTAMDWIAVVLTGLLGLNLLAFPLWIGPAYDKMFGEFGTVLPSLTQVVLDAWLPLIGLLTVAGLLALGLFRRMGLGRRRLMIVGGFLLALAWAGACWWGLYLPIFNLAGAIQA